MSPLYHFGVFLADPLERRLQREGQTVALTPKAFEVLVALLERQGRLVTKADLLRRVWPDAFIEEATLVQNIATLRRVFGEHPGERQYIETVPKLGYRFIAPVRVSSAPCETNFMAAPATQPLPAVPDRPSVAVLPFLNVNKDEEGEFFADGMAEDITGALATFPGLRVVARSSAFQFKGRSPDWQEVRDRLRVTAILCGTVRRTGRRIRVTAELISAVDGFQMWSERYDRVQEDIFAIQDEVSRAIARKLEIRLGAGPVVVNRTANIEAYKSYVRGRHHWTKRTPAGYQKAEEYFRRAITQDPTFGPPHAGLADGLILSAFYGFRNSLVCVPPARELLQHALSVDPALAEAHASWGFLEAGVWLDFDAAEAHFAAAHRLKPHQALTFFWQGCCVIGSGRLTQALEMFETAALLEPTVAIYSVGVAVALRFLGRPDLALQQLRQVLEMEPSFPIAQLHLGICLIETGRAQDGIQLIRLATPGFAQGGFWAAGELGYRVAQVGDHSGAITVLDSLLSLRESGYAQPTAVAAVYVGLGDNDRALDWLDIAYQERSGVLVFVAVDPLWVRLREHPRFRQLIARIFSSST